MKNKIIKTIVFISIIGAFVFLADVASNHLRMQYFKNLCLSVGGEYGELGDDDIYCHFYNIESEDFRITIPKLNKF